MTTIELGAPALPVAAPRTAVWARVSNDLWTANTSGDFLGTVERVGERYYAVDDLGMPLGSASTLEDAQRRVLRPRGRVAALTARRQSAEDRLAAATAWIAGSAILGILAMFVLEQLH